MTAANLTPAAAEQIKQQSTPSPAPSIPPTPAITPPSVLLMGMPGSGKTFSIGTLAMSPSNLRVCAICTENTGVPALIDSFRHYKAPIEKLHYATCTADVAGINALSDVAKILKSNSFESLSKMKDGIARQQTQSISRLYDLMLDFKCERTGQSLGPVTAFGPDTVFVLDSLSGLNDMVRQNFMGLKAALAPGEWGVIMENEVNLIKLLAKTLNCFVVIIAHLDREKDEVTGGTTVVPAALGSKVGPKLGQHFNEVILQKRTPSGFFWSTNDAQASCFQRALPAESQMRPSFTPVVQSHKDRLASISTPTSTQ